jgi:hypothetical protein
MEQRLQMEKMKKELRSFKETEKSASKSQLPKFLEMTKAARDEERRNLEFALALQREEVELQNDIIMVEHLGAPQFDTGPNPDTMTYEQLMELGDQLGKVSRGLTTEQIDALKAVKYYKTSAGSQNANSSKNPAK